MATIAPPTFIAPPAPDPHRFGIFSVANMPDSSGRWELGVEWQPLDPARAVLRSHEACPEVYAEPVLPEPGLDDAEGIPFLVTGTFRCAPTGWSTEEAEERARLHLNTGEERAVEYAIATGAMGNEPSLQGATDLTPTPGTAVDLDDAVALIEARFAAQHHSSATIHAPARLGVPLDTGRIARRQGQRIETLLGSLVAVGGGYEEANVGPTGTPPAAGEAWIYATGRPTVRRSEVWIDQDREHYVELSTNDQLVLAHRAYLVTWDGPTVAVLVNAPGA